MKYVYSRQMIKLSKTDAEFRSILFRKIEGDEMVELFHPQLSKWVDAKHIDTSAFKFEVLTANALEVPPMKCPNCNPPVMHTELRRTPDNRVAARCRLCGHQWFPDDRIDEPWLITNYPARMYVGQIHIDGFTGVFFFDEDDDGVTGLVWRHVGNVTAFIKTRTDLDTLARICGADVKAKQYQQQGKRQ